MTTIATPHSIASSRRLWFAADAVVTGANGVAYLAAAPLLADLLGGDALTHRWIGGFLLAFAVAVAVYARSSMPVRAGWAIVVANVLWVVASVDVAITGALGLDDLGRGWAVAQALVVAAFAALQARALRTR